MSETEQPEGVNPTDNRLPDEAAINPAPEPEAKPEGEQAPEPEAKPEGEAEGDEHEDDDAGKSDPNRAKRRRAGRYERQLGRLEAERDFLARQLAAATKAPQKPADGDAPPREEDFGGDPVAYERALIRYEARKETRAEFEAQEKRRTEEARERQLAEREAAFSKRVETARERFEDFDAVAFNDATPINDAMAEVIWSSEKGPDLAYHLGSHPDEARRIASLPPIQAARELGLIEAKLSLPQRRTATNAPNPIKPVGGGGASAPVDPNKLSYEEYRDARMKGRIK